MPNGYEIQRLRCIFADGLGRFNLTTPLQHSANKDCLLFVLLNRKVFYYEAAQNCYADNKQGFSGG